MMKVMCAFLEGPPHDSFRVGDEGTGGEVANALVCKTSIHGFNSHPVLQLSQWMK
jgi:hypothetical protein